MGFSWKCTVGFFGVLVIAALISVASYRSGFEQGSNVALCLVSTFQKGTQKQGLDMSSPSCRAAKQGENNPLWVARKRHPSPPRTKPNA